MNNQIDDLKAQANELRVKYENERTKLRKKIEFLESEIEIGAVFCREAPGYNDTLTITAINEQECTFTATYEGAFADITSFWVRVEQ